jgi:hypothetical protein
LKVRPKLLYVGIFGKNADVMHARLAAKFGSQFDSGKDDKLAISEILKVPILVTSIL